MSRLRLSLLLLGAVSATPASAQQLEPIIYTIRAPAPSTQIVKIEARVPTGRRPTLDLTMAVWSPGFYRVENYADRLDSLSAKSPDGAPLVVDHTAPNRWEVRPDATDAQRRHFASWFAESGPSGVTGG